MRIWGGKTARSIALPIFALVLAALVVDSAVHFAVTFNGPPMRPGVRTAGDLAAMLRTGQAPANNGPGPRLEVIDQAAAPVPLKGANRDTIMEAAIAGTLSVAADRIRVYEAMPLEGHVYAFGAREDPLRPPPLPPGMMPPFSSGARMGLEQDWWGRRVLVGWHRGAGWRVIRHGSQPWLTPWHEKTLLAMLLALLILAVPAWLIARAISRPLRQLAEAASRARALAPLGPMPSRGATEIRQLTEAVGDMHARLARHAEARTALLAAIAHDLGTPLARLAFRVERLPDDARAKAIADIEEMRAMIAATILFARDEAGASQSERVDLGSLLESLADDMGETGRAVTVEPGPAAVVRGDPTAYRRLFTNLVDNALRYGGEARLEWSVCAREVEVRVLDRGPGVDLTQVERLFDPFVRGEPSRNRVTGGTGLGLAIVRSIAEINGGSVLLENSPMGGAIARVQLPTD